ncbi:unnamed protein product [Brassica rapa]|uniref:MGS-like domain-containing protein n=1 Tax=Brassica campestris TaxID=3711 RepID=A0A8D9HDA4_BRACM|nr:unnamed protein product [Brassica rapa]
MGVCTSGKKQALISLSDKKDLATFGKGLQELGYTIVSTGETASTLENAVQLDGRVKTLHPNIHGGILDRRDVEHHMEALNEHDGIENIDIGGPTMIRAAAKVYMVIQTAATAALGVRNRVQYRLALVPLNQSPFFLCATLQIPVKSTT